MLQDLIDKGNEAHKIILKVCQVLKCNEDQLLGRIKKELSKIEDLKQEIRSYSSVKELRTRNAETGV